MSSSLKSFFLILILISSTMAVKTEDFLSSLILSRYSHCSIFFLRYGEYESVGVNLLNNVALKSNTVYQNAKFQLIKSNITANLKLPEVYHQKSDRCKLVIIQMTEIMHLNFKDIYRRITPAYLPTTMKGYDFYVYVTKLELIDKLLLSYELPARTKYKIAVAEDKDKLIIKSVCFFCNEGNALIVNYPLDSLAFEYFPDYLSNFNGKTLKISCPYIKSRIEVDPPYAGINNAKRGMYKSLIEEFIMAKLNFTYNIFVSTGADGNKGGGGTGLELSNGTWIGAVGDVIEGKADFAIASTNTPKRQMFISVSSSFFYKTYLNFVTSVGLRVYSPLTLLWTFDLLMWFCIFLSTIFVFVFFKLLISSMKLLGIDKDMNFARRGIVTQEAWGFRQQIVFVGTSFLDQDCELPRSTPLRCLVALWLFFALIITTVYRSKMVSLLAFPYLEQIPETYSELAYSDYKIGFLKQGDAAYNTLKAGNDPVYKRLMGDVEIVSGKVKNGLECIEKAIYSRYACISYDLATIYLKAANLTDSQIRNLAIAPDTTYNIYVPLIMEGGSIYKEGIDKLFGWAGAFYLAQIWVERDMYTNIRLPKRDWWLATNQSYKLAHNDAENNEVLTLKHISGVFYALLLCLVVSTIVFTAEALYLIISSQFYSIFD